MRVLRAYALAAISVTIALLLTSSFLPAAQQFKFLLFFFAVFASATGGSGRECSRHCSVWRWQIIS